MHGAHYNVSAARLRDLLKNGLWKSTDLRDAPEKFFAAHRLLSAHAAAIGEAFLFAICTFVSSLHFGGL